MFHNNIVEISEKKDNRNLLKVCLQITYSTDFCKICIQFYYGKSEHISFLEKQWLE